MSELQAEWEKIRRQAWERQLRGHLHGRPPHDEDACEQLPEPVENGGKAESRTQKEGEAWQNS